AQSYTYFTWKNTRWELLEFIGQLLDWGETYRPNAVANTPDILHEYLQRGERGVPRLGEVRDEAARAGRPAAAARARAEPRAKAESRAAAPRQHHVPRDGERAALRVPEANR